MEKPNIVPYGNGFAIEFMGKQHLSSHGTPFETEESAKRYITLCTYLRPKPPFDVLNSKKTRSAAAQAPCPPASPRKVEAAPKMVETPCIKHSSPSCTAVLDIIGHTPAETTRPVKMCEQDFHNVHVVYEKVVDSFTRDQLYILNDLLYRYNQAWNLTEQLQKAKALSAAHDNKTAWKYPKNNQLEMEEGVLA